MLAGDNLPTDHFQVSHQQLMVSGGEMQRNLSDGELTMCLLPLSFSLGTIEAMEVSVALQEEHWASLLLQLVRPHLT